MPSDTRRVGPRAPVVIELVGIPGAGKTTLARRLVVDLAATGTSATTMTEAGRRRAARTRTGAAARRLPPRLASLLLWQRHLAGGRAGAIALCWRHPRLVVRVLATQWSRPGVPARLRAHVLRWWFAHAGRRAFLAGTARPGDVLVVDDGFVHRAATLHAGPGQPPRDDAVSAYVAAVPRPDLLVVVTADPPTCADRVRARGVWRHRPLDPVALAWHLVHAEQAVAAAVRTARDLGWDVLEVDNDGQALDAVAARLLRDVRARWDVPRSDDRPMAGVVR